MIVDSGQLDCLNDNSKEYAYFNGTNSSPLTNLSFIYHVLKNGGSVSEILKGFFIVGKEVVGLEKRYKEQFEVDFPRAGIEVIDQNGNKVFEHSLYIEIKNRLEEKGKKVDSYDNIVKEMEEILKLTPQQSRYIVANFNQRNIEGTPTLFNAISKEDNNKFISPDRKSSFCVIVNERGEINSTDKIKVDANVKLKTVNAVGVDEKDFYTTSYEADISSFKGDSGDKKLLLPVDVPKEEKITYKALVPEAAYPLAQELQKIASNMVSGGVQGNSEEKEKKVLSENNKKRISPEILKNQELIKNSILNIPSTVKKIFKGKFNSKETRQ